MPDYACVLARWHGNIRALYLGQYWSKILTRNLFLFK